MRMLEGTALLVDGDSRREVRLLLDLQRRCFIAEHICDEDLMTIFRRISASESEIVHLQDAMFLSPMCPLSCSQTGRLHVVERVSGTHEPDVYAATQETPSIGTSRTRLVLSPASSIVEFKTDKAETSTLIYNCHRLSIPRTGFTVDGSAYVFSFEGTHCLVDSPALIWGKHRRLRLALSILFGTRAQLFAARESGTLYLNVARDIEYQRSHALFEYASSAGPILECLTRFLLALSDREFNHWHKATAFMIEGKSSYAELEIRITNLFVFLEMFDAADRLSGNAVAEMLEIPLSDAKLLCGVRNKLVHEGHTLLEAIEASDAELRTHNPRHEVHAFDLAGQSAGAMLYLRLCERINHFVARKIAWHGKHNAYRGNLADYAPA
jgi:hypothetical protein